MYSKEFVTWIGAYAYCLKDGRWLIYKLSRQRYFTLDEVYQFWIKNNANEECIKP